MRVLHISRGYLKTSLHQLMMSQLEKIGIENQVFVPNCKEDECSVSPKPNVCVSKCFNLTDRFIFSLKQFKIVRAAEKNVDVKSFDIIHAYTLFTDGNAAMKLAEKYKKPFVVAVRNTDVNDFFAKLFYLRRRGIEIMRKAHKIFFLSEAYRKNVFEKYVPRRYHDELFKKTIILPNGIDDFWFENNFQKKNILHQPVKLIYVGQIDKNKNIPTIKAAMDNLEKLGLNATLTIVGKIADKSEFNKVKDDPRISYLQAMPKEKLIEEYRIHDIFVMPSFTESFGLVYAEAMSQGLPVVYSKGQGFDNQFEEGFVGYHCDAHDANDVAKAIKNVVNEYENIQKNCQSASKKFRWDEICKKYQCVYNSLI